MREDADIEAHLRGSREQLLIDHFQCREAELVVNTQFKRAFGGKRIKLRVLLSLTPKSLGPQSALGFN